MPPELDVPELPEIAQHVWSWFLDLSGSRQSGPITYSEIKAWSQLTRIYIQPWEVRALKALDTEFLKVQSEHG